MDKLIKEYTKDGYCIGPKILSQNLVIELREKLEIHFNNSNYPRDISLFDLNDKELIKKILQIYIAPEIQNFLKKLEMFTKEKIFFLPRFIVHRNYHVDRLNTPDVGWHRDCGGELNYEFCKRALTSHSYVFGKMGIYLQENSNFGGSIDLIPKSHKNIKFNKPLLRKISDFRLFIIRKIQKNFVKLYKLFSEKNYMNFLKALKLFPEPGSFVIFDSRIIHRGSPIADIHRNQIIFESKKYFAKQIPKEKTKFSLYSEIGSKLGFESYLYDRNQRNEKKKIIDIFNYELKQIEIYNTELAKKIKNMFYDIMLKYY